MTHTRSHDRDHHDRRQVVPERSGREAGFTLMELVLAVAIIATSFMVFLEQRIRAVDRVHDFTRDRRIQAQTREKLEEIVYGDEDERSGEFIGPPAMTWTAEFTEVSESGQNPLVECRLIVKWVDETDQEQEYQLSSRVFPPRDSPLIEEMENARN